MVYVRRATTPFMVAFLLTGFITLWSMSALIRSGGFAQSQLRSMRPSPTDIVDHDTGVRNEAEIVRLRELVERMERKSAGDDARISRLELREASGSGGMYALVTAFGLILTALGIYSHVSIRKGK